MFRHNLLKINVLDGTIVKNRLLLTDDAELLFVKW